VGASCSGQVNYAEVGMTEAQAKSCGSNVDAAWKAAEVPPTSVSVDNEINKCYPETGTARQDCWIQFDKDVMENVVPWVPYRFGTNVTVLASDVTNYDYDQFAGTPAWCKIAVSNNINPNTL